MQYHNYEDSVPQESSLSSSSSTYSSATSLTSEDRLAANGIKYSTALPKQPQSQSQFTLNQVLSNPKLLCAFECFLRQSWAHENLLFIEAMTQLKHETDPKLVESTLHRIYKTFLAQGSPMELNVTTQEKVKQDIGSLQWAIVDRIDAVTILEDTEAQVLDMLETKLSEFMQTMDFPLGTINPAKIKSEQVRVVIIGGGFTGFTVASILDQMPRFYVTLIDTKDSFEYTPGIVRKIIKPEQSSALRVRHDAYVQNGRVIIGYAENLANHGTTVTVNAEEIKFDYLVIATGSSYSSHLKSMDTSSLYRMSGLEQSYLELLKARKVLIIGGGLVGCELASEISQHTFPGAHPKKEVTLIDSHPNVVSRSDVRQQNVALKYLQDLGVNVICNERIIDFDSSNANTYLGLSGRLYAGYDKVFIATGTRPNTSLLTATSSSDPSIESCIDATGRIKVKPTLQIDHYKYTHIFAGGDVTNVVEEKTGYAATISGVCIARNICRLVKGKTPLKQGTKGTLPAPYKPLHGMLEHGGIGKQNLNSIKKRFSFLNPSWAALKYFDEQQFLKIVQGQGTINSSQVLGRLPRKLNLPPSSNHQPTSLPHPLHQSQYPHHHAQHTQPTNHSIQHSKSTPTVKATAANMCKQKINGPASSHKLHPTSQTGAIPSVVSNNKLQTGYSEPFIRNSNDMLSKSSILSTSTVDPVAVVTDCMLAKSNADYPIPVPSSPTSKRMYWHQRPPHAHTISDRSTSTASTALNAENDKGEVLKPLEGFVFEHFTFGGEDLHLFSNSGHGSVLNTVKTSATSQLRLLAKTTRRKRSNTTRAESRYMSSSGPKSVNVASKNTEYDMAAVFLPHQLSPRPPPRHAKSTASSTINSNIQSRRRASLSSSIHSLSLTNTSTSSDSKCVTGVPLRRSPSASSVTLRF